jgi:hypothetical protein
MLRTSTTLIRQAGLRRANAYEFGPHQPQNAWQKYRERQMVAGFPPNEHPNVCSSTLWLISNC